MPPLPGGKLEHVGRTIGCTSPSKPGEEDLHESVYPLLEGRNVGRLLFQTSCPQVDELRGGRSREPRKVGCSRRRFRFRVPTA